MTSRAFGWKMMGRTEQMYQIWDIAERLVLFPDSNQVPRFGPPARKCVLVISSGTPAVTQC
jgi:hypothetical protein